MAYCTTYDGQAAQLSWPAVYTSVHAKVANINTCAAAAVCISRDSKADLTPIALTSFEKLPSSRLTATCSSRACYHANITAIGRTCVITYRQKHKEELVAFNSSACSIPPGCEFLHTDNLLCPCECTCFSKQICNSPWKA